MKTHIRIGTMLVAVFAAVVFVLAMAVPSSPSEAASGDDAERVREAVFNYFRGASQGDVSIMEKAWDKPTAHLKHVARTDQGAEEVRVIPIAEMFQRWAQNPSPGSKGSVLSMDIVDGAMAVVKFQFTTPEKTYIDYLSLYKVNGQWKIINKIYIVR